LRFFGSKSPEGEIYYFNFNTGESVWDHPCDEYYKCVRRRGYPAIEAFAPASHSSSRIRAGWSRKLYAEEKAKWEKRMVERELERKRRPATSAGGGGSGIKPVAQGGVGFKGLQPLGSSLGSLNAPSRLEYGRGGPDDSGSAKGGTDEEPKSSAALMAAAAMKRHDHGCLGRPVNPVWNEDRGAAALIIRVLDVGDRMMVGFGEPMFGQVWVIAQGWFQKKLMDRVQ
jgi:hypothetical protein